MTSDDLNQIRGVVKEEVNTALEPVVKKLDALWDQTIRLTEDTEEIKDKLKSQTSALNRTSDNIEKVDKRVIKVEGNLGIVSPPELTIIR